MATQQHNVSESAFEITLIEMVLPLSIFWDEWKVLAGLVACLCSPLQLWKLFLHDSKLITLARSMQISVISCPF